MIKPVKRCRVCRLRPKGPLEEDMDLTLCPNRPTQGRRNVFGSGPICVCVWGGGAVAAPGVRCTNSRSGPRTSPKFVQII